MDLTDSDKPAAPSARSPRLSLQRSVRSPMGPRTRQGAPAMLSLDGAATMRNSTISTTSTLYSPGPMSPVKGTEGGLPGILESESSHIPEPRTEESSPLHATGNHPFPTISAAPSPTTSVPSPGVSLPKRQDSLSATRESAGLGPPSTPVERHPSPSLTPGTGPSPRIQKIPKPQTIPPPPELRFEDVPVRWKGLPLEAALWTFTSKELQQIVSRAIRSSAHESFIRLLTIESLDNAIPTEIERLCSLKATRQSKYRFSVQRRTMLLQALNSFSTRSGGKEEDGGTELVSRLALQLAEITAECDKIAEELMQVTDQIGQLKRLIDVHWGSALAIALRKLNGSYGKRTADLIAAKNRINQLDAELEDAWKEAEKMAKELDERDAAEDDAPESDSGSEIDQEGTAIIGTAEVVSVSPPLSPRPTVFSIPPKSHSRSASQASLLVLASINAPQDEVDNSDKVSVRSRRSVRSHRSTRSIDTSRVSIVSAAKRRSVRTSMGSLRIPTRKVSLRTTSTFRDSKAPPVPEIPKEYSPSTSPPPAPTRDPPPPPSPAPTFTYPPSTAATSFLNFESPSASTVDLAATLGIAGTSKQRKASIDDLHIVARPRTGNGLTSGVRPQSAVDDIVIMPRTKTTDSEEDEIREVPRFKPYRKSVDDISLVANTRRLNDGDQQRETIPSIWLNADAPKTPAERVESMMREQERSKSASYRKLKSFTKRYSMPFPNLMAKSLSSLKSNHGGAK